MTTVAEIEHLKKSFGSNAVLKDISFKINKGENLAIFGKSGSGKSVLIKCLVGLIEPDEGKVVLLDKDISELNTEELNSLRKKIGFLFQSAALYDSMTVRENIAFPLRDLKSKPKDEIEALVIEALKNVGLEDAIGKMPSELSGGMRKRIGLARTLILKPEIILYDEPTTGLDPITSREISQLILDIQKKYNTASIIITHDVECAHIAANRIIMIKDGTSAAEGTYEELSISKDEWVCSFFK
jgi:phospholipid/cholesterol/gamma-HCH transport system ATP-binding protein